MRPDLGGKLKALVATYAACARWHHIRYLSFHYSKVDGENRPCWDWWSNLDDAGIGDLCDVSRDLVFI